MFYASLTYESFSALKTSNMRLRILEHNTGDERQTFLKDLFNTYLNLKYYLDKTKTQGNYFTIDLCVKVCISLFCPVFGYTCTLPWHGGLMYLVIIN